MVTRRRKRRRGKKSLLPVQDSSYCRDSILYRSGLGSYDPLNVANQTFASSHSLASCKLPSLFFWLSFLQLSALILRRSPANRILFALRQDKHCPCVTPKTFHRLSHFQHGSDISIIGFFLLLKCSEETMRVKRKNEEPKQGSGSISTRNPLKYVWKAPPHGPFLSYSAVQ